MPRVSVAVLSFVLTFVCLPASAQVSDTAVVTRWTYVFVTPEVRQEAVAQLEPGVAVSVIDDSGDWIIVEYTSPRWGARRGYVQRADLKLMQRPPAVTVPPATARQSAGGLPFISGRALSAPTPAATPRLQPKRSGWRVFAEGLMLGLHAYAQAAQATASRSALYDSANIPRYGRVPTFQPIGGSHRERVSGSQTLASIGGFGYATTTLGSEMFSTTSQRIGPFTYATTTGSAGYYASAMSQRIGDFEFTNGHSGDGAFWGTRQRIGDFEYSSLQAPSGMWFGSGQQIGDLTYRTYLGPNGQMITSTTQQIGQFSFSTIR